MHPAASRPLRSSPAVTSSRLSRLAVASALLAGVMVAACGGPDPKTGRKVEEVPANSAIEARQENDEKLRRAEAEAAAEKDKPQYGRVSQGDVPSSNTVAAAAVNSGSGGGSSGAGPGGKSGTSSKGGGKAGSAASGGATGGGATGGGATGGGGKITKAECGQLFDKYIDLEVASNSAFQGLGPELKGMIESAKAQARQQKGDPCDSQPPTRSQYDCAMGARSTDEWKRCMK